MSHPSRPWERGLAPRRRRDIRLESPQVLEERWLLTPVVALAPLQATFTAAATPANTDLGTVTVAPSTTTTTFPTAAPLTSVSELTPISQFGGDIVRIKAGPGGVFGSGVYAISRGAGENTGAVNRPGVIYRVDPATGKASVFFDLNTLISQLEPGSNASNSVGAQTGLVNWYDIAFDPEGYFDGRPSMFVASVDMSDPNKNVIYRIGPDGSFMGAFVQFTAMSNLKFTTNPTSILVPPPEDQTFLRGLLAGAGISTTNGEFGALFFNANSYTPGQVISSSTLPTGVSQTKLGQPQTGVNQAGQTVLGMTGPVVGMTATNPDYLSRVYGAFTDFGTTAAPGYSGVQGINGDLLMNAPPGTTLAAGTAPPLDQAQFATTPFRRFQDIAFDQYGYFSQGVVLPTNSSTTNLNGTITINPTTLTQPVNAGSLFVTDLSAGLEVTVTPVAPLPTTPIMIPIQGPGPVGVMQDPTTTTPKAIPIVTNGNTTDGSNSGGRIIRILPNGVASVFAYGFHTSASQGPDSFINSSLSISFSADGTTLYASDDDGIWQFKTTASLAGSTSGSLIGLNDLRSLGVPYDGQDSAVAIVDSGVDALSTPFRGRVAPGTNVITNGSGNSDTAPSNISGPTTTTTTGVVGNSSITIGVDGHGTPVAGVVAQFVPQATIEPVNIFNPFQLFTPTTPTTTTAATFTASSNAVATTNSVYKGLVSVAQHPFINDPIRPNKADRVIASTFGFGTTETFNSEGVAYRRYPQIVIAFKNQLKKYRNLGIAPIAATGQFGSPYASGVSTITSTTTTTTTTSNAGGATNNQQNPNVGDVNGIAFPAILNEVISVTGSYSFPFSTGPAGLPTSPPSSAVAGGSTPIPPQVPLLVGISNSTIGGTSSSTTTTAATTSATTTDVVTALTAGDFAIFSDRLFAADNRSTTTDFAAPALNIPTFRRTFSVPSAIGTTTTNASGTTTVTVNGQTIDPTDRLTFQEGGTSLSAAIVSGAYALVSSALDYWSKLNITGTTADAYLTQPVGARTLSFGPHAFKDLSAYNNPDGINAILAWTAVPATDANNGLSAAAPPTLINSTHYRQFARINVGNAIAAVEGIIAIQYLLDHNVFPIIDANHDGIITAQELQTFVDNSATMGMPEAGAMARLLGGTAREPSQVFPQGFTADGEQPDQPDVLQRRFNFFDYAADGQLNGSVTIDQFKMVAHTLLPKPDAYVINNRPKASTNGFLVDPTAHRNFQDLQHIKLNYEFVPARAFLKYRGLPPDRFKVNRFGAGDTVFSQFPVYELYSGNNPRVIQQNTTSSNSTSGSTPGPLTTDNTSAGGTASTTTTSTTGTATTSTTGTASTSTTGTASTSTTGTASPASANSGTGNQGAGSTVVGSSTGATSGTGAPVIANPQGVTAQGVAVVNNLIQSLQSGQVNGSIGTATPAGTVGPVLLTSTSPSTGATTTASTPLSIALPKAVPVTVAPTSGEALVGATAPANPPVAPAHPLGPRQVQAKAKQKN
jgi:hypothetical protein